MYATAIICGWKRPDERYRQTPNRLTDGRCCTGCQWEHAGKME